MTASELLVWVLFCVVVAVLGSFDALDFRMCISAAGDLCDCGARLVDAVQPTEAAQKGGV